MTKLAPEWVRTSDPVIRSPARYRWTTAPATRPWMWRRKLLRKSCMIPPVGHDTTHVTAQQSKNYASICACRPATSTVRSFLRTDCLCHVSAVVKHWSWFWCQFMCHHTTCTWASPDGWVVWGVVVFTRWWLLVDHCVLRNWDRILVRAVKGLISRAGMVWHRSSPYQTYSCRSLCYAFEILSSLWHICE